MRLFFTAQGESTKFSLMPPFLVEAYTPHRSFTLHFREAREFQLQNSEKQGLFIRATNHAHDVSTGHRSHSPPFRYPYYNCSLVDAHCVISTGDLSGIV